MKNELADQASSVFATIACTAILSTAALGILAVFASVVMTFAGMNHR